MNKCPFCKGTGQLQPPYHKATRRSEVDWSSIMKFLNKEGYSYSQMMEITGFKSKRSIKIYIEQ